MPDRRKESQPPSTPALIQSVTVKQKQAWYYISHRDSDSLRNDGRIRRKLPDIPAVSDSKETEK